MLRTNTLASSLQLDTDQIQRSEAASTHRSDGRSRGRPPPTSGLTHWPVTCTPITRQASTLRPQSRTTKAPRRRCTISLRTHKPRQPREPSSRYSGARSNSSRAGSSTRATSSSWTSKWRPSRPAPSTSNTPSLTLRSRSSSGSLQHRSSRAQSNRSSHRDPASLQSSSCSRYQPL